MRSSELHALLIGIDRYSYRGDPARGLYPDLEGAVRDATRLEAFLLERGLSSRRIRKLAASVDAGAGPALAPTYERILEAIAQIRRQARTGDRVLIGFSGHGGRVPTLCPDTKGADGIDEALVPAGIGEPDGCYLHDVEMAFLLQRLKDDGLLVTLILDCCHAGGASRERARGSGRVDFTAQRRDSLVAGREELERAWQTSSGGQGRHLTAASGWLPDPRGYVLLAACQAYERAFEGWYDASGPGGALTRALLDTARCLGPQATCREIHARAVDQVREWNEAQTPQLEGDADRIFLGVDERPPPARAAGASPNRLEASRLCQLDNPSSSLGEALRLALYRLPPGFDPERTGGELLAIIDSLAPLTGTVDARVGEWLCLVLYNDSRQALHVAIFDHEPEGGVSRVYPADGVGETELLAAGGREALPLAASLADGLRRGIDVLQAVASADPTFFRQLSSGAPSQRSDWAVARLEVRLERR